jgi:hypothetical protein
MSVGPNPGIVTASLAGAPLAEKNSGAAEKTTQEVATRQRKVESVERAEKAEGIGETDGSEHQSEERDADGRRPWERMGKPAQKDQEKKEHVKDPSGQSGNLLDLSG